MQERGVTFRPLIETVRDEIAWFQQYSYTTVSALPAPA